ncbi:MAG TPA: TerC family protein [Gemmatimonadales bacterium]|jgi:predicted tellurium resistance membrane protein TerC|nr:TerC family protein [Gemmatimonadales bacterium]
MNLFTSPEAWLGLLTLTVLEIVLGIDNIIFISILAGKLPREQQGRARRVGLIGAMLTRIALLAALAWIIRLTAPWFELLGHPFSGRDLILIAGGLFLIAKSTREIHEGLEGDAGRASGALRASFAAVVGQIMILDVVFSLDSVITAVGMARHLPVMIAAVVLAVGVMLFAATPISEFVHRHPTIKMLGLSFLLLIGVSLIADGLGQHIAKGYIYFAMGFSVFVEMLNIRVRARNKPVALREAYTAETPTPRS